MVLLSIPRTPKGQRPRFEWELRRRDRRRFRVTEPIRLAQLAEAERLAQAARFQQLAELAQGGPGTALSPEPDPPPRS